MVVRKVPSVAISYASEDAALADDIYQFLNQRLDEEGRKKYDVFQDRVSVVTSDFFNRIRESFERAQAVVVLISAASLNSPWVQFELNMALGRQMIAQRDDPVAPISDVDQETDGEEGEHLVPDMRLVPVLVEPVDRLPRNNVILQYLNVVDFTTALEASNTFTEIGIRVDELLGSIDESETKFLNVRRQFNLQTNYTRLFGQLGDVFAEILQDKTSEFSDKLDAINRAFAASTSLLSPAHISIKERDATEAIWVVSADLYNDLHVPEFEESIIDNFRRGLHYVYFIENAERFDKMVERFDSIYGRIDLSGNGKLEDNKPHYHFVPLAPGTVMPFDEVVIYDPKAGRITSSYVQITFDQHPNKQTVYIDLPLSATEKMVQKLDVVYQKFLKKK